MTSRAAKPLAAAAIAQLEADGVATLIGTVVNPAGLTHAKTVPLRRMGAFADPGLGASPVFHVFAIDQTGIVFGDAIGVVGTSASGSTSARCASSETGCVGRRALSSTRTVHRIPIAAAAP